MSVLVGYLLFVREAVSILAAKPDALSGPIRARLASPFGHRGDRMTCFPSKVIDGGVETAGLPSIEPLPWQGSADLRTIALADGFAGLRDGLALLRRLFRMMARGCCRASSQTRQSPLCAVPSRHG